MGWELFSILVTIVTCLRWLVNESLWVMNSPRWLGTGLHLWIKKPLISLG